MVNTPGCGCGGGETQPPDEFNPSIIQQGGAAVATASPIASSATPVPHVTYGYEHGATSPQQEALLRVVKGAQEQSAANNQLGGAGIPVPQVHTPVTYSGPDNPNTISASANQSGVQGGANRAFDACIGQGETCTLQATQAGDTAQDGGKRHSLRKHRSIRRRHHKSRKGTTHKRVGKAKHQSRHGTHKKGRIHARSKHHTRTKYSRRHR
jgi:hypothetical protein